MHWFTQTSPVKRTSAAHTHDIARYQEIYNQGDTSSHTRTHTHTSPFSVWTLNYMQVFLSITLRAQRDENKCLSAWQESPEATKTAQNNICLYRQCGSFGAILKLGNIFKWNHCIKLKHFSGCRLTFDTQPASAYFGSGKGSVFFFI